MARWNAGDLKGAIAADESAIRLLRTTGSPAILGEALGNLGVVYLVGAHDPERAESLYREALDLDGGRSASMTAELRV